MPCARLRAIRCSRGMSERDGRKRLVYIETSVISYLTARTSRDVLTAARQTWIREWWAVAHQH